MNPRYQTIHLIHQGLFTLTKMRRAPERGRQVLKLVRQDYFPVAWDLHGFAAALGLVSHEAHRGWLKALGRVGKENQPEKPTDASEHQPQRPRRRPRRRRRR